jgi:hypothetical protein
LGTRDSVSHKTESCSSSHSLLDLHILTI